MSFEEKEDKTLPDVRARGGASKLDTVQLAEGAHRRLAEDGAARYGILIEALRPGAFDEKRADAAVAGISARASRLRAGDVSDISRDLCAQVAFLGALVTYCVGRGTASGIPEGAGGAWIALSLKAASVQARTSATLAQLVLANPKAINDD